MLGHQKTKSSSSRLDFTVHWIDWLPNSQTTQRMLRNMEFSNNYMPFYSLQIETHLAIFTFLRLLKGVYYER